MGEHILIIIILAIGGSIRPATSIDSVTFTSAAACKAAAINVRANMPTTSSPYPKFIIVTTCNERHIVKLARRN